jgi:Tol biopolymer transport system component
VSSPRVAASGGAWRQASAVAAAVLLASVVVWSEAAEGAYPGANGAIAFETNRDGNLEIYAMAADGSAPVNLTQDPAEDGDPTWSPDGDRLAFVKASEGHRNVYVMGADGSAPTNLTPGPVTTDEANDGTNPTWSPDGTRIAYASSDGDIWVVSAGGGTEANLTGTPATTAVETQPAWSPDGSRIAYVRGADLWVMDADGGGQRPLTATTGSGQDEKAPDWSPDGSRLVYGKGSAVWVADADGSDQRLLVSSSVLPAWSPDGTRIVFSSSAFDAQNGPDLFTVAPDGSGVARLPTAANATDTDPSWQPAAGPAPTSTTTSTSSTTTSTSSSTTSTSSSTTSTSSSTTSTSSSTTSSSTTSTTAPRPSLCDGRPITVYGTPGPDVIELPDNLFGRPRVVHALGGNDQVLARYGVDIVCGGDGRDWIRGGSQDDRLFGGAGDDLLEGGSGDDTLFGEDGRDTCYGDLGRDVAYTCEVTQVEAIGTPDPAVNLDDASVRPGDAVVVSVTGFADGTTVDIELHSTPVLLGTLTVADGAARGTFTIPRSTPVGSHRIVASGTGEDGEAVTASAALTVERQLPRTGAPVRALLQWALLLVGVGLLAAGRAQLTRAR